MKLQENELKYFNDLNTNLVQKIYQIGTITKQNLDIDKVKKQNNDKIDKISKDIEKIEKQKQILNNKLISKYGEFTQVNNLTGQISN